MAYPSSIDTIANPAGTQTLGAANHAGLHQEVNTAITAIETVLGTTAGTSVLKNFSAGHFPARINTSNVFQHAVQGTINASTIGTPRITGGTASAFIVGTSTIQGGTANNVVIGTPAITGGTINTPSIQTRFTASGQYDNGNSGTAVTINWTNGDRQKLTLTGNCTITYSGAIAGQILNLSIDQDGTGGRTVTLPTSMWPNSVAGSFGTAASAKNELVVKYDGTNYRTQLSASFGTA